MDVKPLSWPKSVREPNGLQKFLKRMPLIGPDRFAWRAFRKQVAGRPEECLALWKQDEQTIATRDAMIDILQKAIGWEGRKFIPADPCDVLFFNPRDSDGMDLLDVMGRMRKQFGIEMDAEGLKQMFAMTFGELVDAIIDKRWEKAPEGWPTGKDRPNKLGCVVAAILVVMVLAMTILYDCWNHSWLSPAAIHWALKATGILGLLNVVLAVVAWATSDRKSIGCFAVVAVASLLLALLLLLCFNG